MYENTGSLQKLGIWMMGLGCAVLSYQIYLFLKTNAWTSLTITSTLIWVGIAPISSWAAWPSDWLGLHRILSGIPTSLALITAGGILFLFS